MGSIISNDVVILAGGLGTRIRGLVPENYPKVMTLVNGRPFLEILLSKIADQGVIRVILALGFGADAAIKFSEYLSVKLGIEIVISIEGHPLGTAGALKNASSHIQTNPFVVMNGDTFSDVNLKKLIGSHLLKKAEATIGLVKVSNPDRFGVVEVDNKTGKVTKFLEKTVGASDALISTGVYVFNKSLMSKIPPNNFSSLELEIFPALIGNDFYGFDFCTKLIDIGTPESLQLSNNYFSKL